MSAQPNHFAPLARLLHWLMALMIIAMLFIGAGMVASVSKRHEWLIHLHKPLGHRHSAVGDCAPRGTLFHSATAVACRFAGLASVGGQGFAHLAVRLDADSAVAGLGNDFGVGRAGDAQQFVAIAIDRAGQCAAVCVLAQGSWVFGVPAVPDRAAASGGGAVPRLGAPRRRAGQHVARQGSQLSSTRSM
jgi:hypothetical protein